MGGAGEDDFLSFVELSPGLQTWRRRTSHLLSEEDPSLWRRMAALRRRGSAVSPQSGNGRACVDDDVRGAKSYSVSRTVSERARGGDANRRPARFKRRRRSPAAGGAAGLVSGSAGGSAGAPLSGRMAGLVARRACSARPRGPAEGAGVAGSHLQLAPTMARSDNMTAHAHLHTRQPARPEQS